MNVEGGGSLSVLNVSSLSAPRNGRERSRTMRKEKGQVANQYQKNDHVVAPAHSATICVSIDKGGTGTETELNNHFRARCVNKGTKVILITPTVNTF